MADKNIQDSRNVVSDSHIHANSVHIGDNIVHQYGDKKIPQVLGRPPHYPDVFVGREDDMQAIHRKLFEESNLLLLMNGQGGIGKTTLAARYYFEHQKEYKHLAWVFAERSLLDALLTMALPLQIDFPAQTPNEQRLQILLNELASLQEPCLLVIDNANQLDDLKKHYAALTTCRNFHILLTTRILHFAKAKSYRVRPLQQQKAIDLFCEYYPAHRSEDDELLKSILQAMGYNTLVTELLAKNLSSLNLFGDQVYSLNDLWVDLQKQGVLRLSQNEVVETYYQGKGQIREAAPEQIIAAMYDLGRLSREELRLLSNFAVLPAENIPFATFLELLQPEEKSTFKKTLHSLYQKGWLDYDEADSSFKISPVVQEIVRTKNEGLAEEVKPLLDNLVEKLKYQPGIGHLENMTYEAAAVYARYGESVVMNVPASTDVLVLCERIANFYTATGNLNKALDYFILQNQKAKELLANNPNNENHKNNLAISYSKLGSTHSSLGNLEAALQFFEKDAKLTKELYAAYPSNVSFKNDLSISYAKLGVFYRDHRSDPAQARQYFQQAEAHWSDLVEQFPGYVEFGRNLEVVREALAEL